MLCVLLVRDDVLTVQCGSKALPFARWVIDEQRRAPVETLEAPQRSPKVPSLSESTLKHQSLKCLRI